LRGGEMKHFVESGAMVVLWRVMSGEWCESVLSPVPHCAWVGRCRSTLGPKRE
jgi:hypothetical protein